MWKRELLTLGRGDVKSRVFFCFFIKDSVKDKMNSKECKTRYLWYKHFFFARAMRFKSLPNSTKLLPTRKIDIAALSSLATMFTVLGPLLFARSLTLFGAWRHVFGLSSRVLHRLTLWPRPPAHSCSRLVQLLWFVKKGVWPTSALREWKISIWRHK